MYQYTLTGSEKLGSPMVNINLAYPVGVEQDSGSIFPRDRHYKWEESVVVASNDYSDAGLQLQSLSANNLAGVSSNPVTKI